jgi:3'-phosphoadenosine 5'-phosphosulfate sulfotransferase (PAPS reductase)/FAD synthetase
VAVGGVNGRVNVISMSGGKDSTATALLALETEPRESLRFVFADTGNEHPATYQYLDYLERRLGITIDRLRADFSDWMAARRMFVARDQRTGRKNGRRIRHTNKMKRRILAVLQPSGNPYLDLCMIKGRFPSRRAQFCTQFLKTEPLVEYQLALIDSGHAVWSWQGIRREEGGRRATALEFEEVGGGLYNYRPILRWTADDVFEAHRAAGIEPNPLYRQGMTRVGCMPCVNVGKTELREIAVRFPEQVARIAEWERLVLGASKPGGASFFAAPDDGRGELRGRDIYSVVQWAKTTRGGRQYDLLGEPEPAACSSAYGLCE